MSNNKTIEPIPATFSQAAGKIAGRKAKGEYRAISLFSGCGGLDIGFLGGFNFHGKVYDRLPFNIIWANDIDRAAC